MAAADSLHLVLDRIVDFITNVIPCDSCFIYVLEGENLMLRASKNPHADLIDHIGLQVGQGVTGWVAKHRQPVAIASAASKDPRFKAFKNIPEDDFEAMLLYADSVCRARGWGDQPAASHVVPPHDRASAASFDAGISSGGRDRARKAGVGEHTTDRKTGDAQGG